MSTRLKSTSIAESTKDCPEPNGAESLRPGSRSDNGLLGPSILPTDRRTRGGGGLENVAASAAHGRVGGLLGDSSP